MLGVGTGYVFDFNIHAQSDDGSTVSFSEDNKSNSDFIFGNFGVIHWMERMYHVTEPGTVRVMDHDMNLDSNMVDSFNVDVWSESDAKGITLAVTETGTATGVFEGEVFFTTSGKSSGNILHVVEGGWAKAKYTDRTLPSSYTLANILDVSGNTRIKVTQPSPLKQYESGVSPEQIQCNRELVLAQKESSNNNPACIKFESIPKLIERGWVKDNSLFDTRISVDDVLMHYDEPSSVATLDISLEISNPNNVTVTLDKVKVVLAMYDIHFRNDVDNTKSEIVANSLKKIDVRYQFDVEKQFTSSIVSSIVDGKPGFIIHGTAHFDSENGFLEVPFIFGKEFQGT